MNTNITFHLCLLFCCHGGGSHYFAFHSAEVRGNSVSFSKYALFSCCKEVYLVRGITPVDRKKVLRPKKRTVFLPSTMRFQSVHQATDATGERKIIIPREFCCLPFSSLRNNENESSSDHRHDSEKNTAKKNKICVSPYFLPLSWIHVTYPKLIHAKAEAEKTSFVVSE